MHFDRRQKAAGAAAAVAIKSYHVSSCLDLLASYENRLHIISDQLQMKVWCCDVGAARSQTETGCDPSDTRGSN